MAKKKPISVHVSDEERRAFEDAMHRDHMVDLGPWIAKVVRQHIAREAETEVHGMIEWLERSLKETRDRVDKLWRYSSIDEQNQMD